jgi:proteic killer suppression protein
MKDVFEVQLSKSAKKDLAKVPTYIARNLQLWILMVSQNGICEIRKIPGFHDEPLKGMRSHQRSIRLSNSYRAIYEIKHNSSSINFIEIHEVNKHEY